MEGRSCACPPHTLRGSLSEALLPGESRVGVVKALGTFLLTPEEAPVGTCGVQRFEGTLPNEAGV